MGWGALKRKLHEHALYVDQSKTTSTCIGARIGPMRLPIVMSEDNVMQSICTFQQNQICTRNTFLHQEATPWVRTYVENNQSVSFQPKGASGHDKYVQQIHSLQGLMGWPGNLLLRAEIAVVLTINNKAWPVVEAYEKWLFWGSICWVVCICNRTFATVCVGTHHVRVWEC